MDQRGVLENLRQFMKNEGLDSFFVKANDEYLNEYTPLPINARYYVTRFTGSTGDALVTPDKVYLFVDGRYHQQADNEVDPEIVTVVKLGMHQSQKDALLEILGEKTHKLGLVSSKISLFSYNKMLEEFKNLEIIEYDYDPVLNYVSKQKNTQSSCKLREIPTAISGTTPDQKLEDIKISDVDVLVLTKLEEIAYLCDLRGKHIAFSSSFEAKAVIDNHKAYVFMDTESLPENLDTQIRKNFEFLPENEFKNHIKKLSNKNLKIGIIETSTNLLTYRQLENSGNEIVILKTSPVSDMKAVKNSSEIAHMKSCFLSTDIVMSRLRTWLAQELESGNKISEKDLSNKVKQLFEEEGAYSLSFEVISSCGTNTSIIHYSNPDPEKYINKADLILIDCGAYFEGGYATDITRTFLAGVDVEPSQEQKTVFTTVLRAFFHGLNYPVNDKTSGYDIDKAVRDVINANLPEGFSFAHGTGHGVGISVHEDPPRISPAESAKAPLVPGMVFTIEPGIYKDGWGGVRLENTVLLTEKDGKRVIQSFARSGFDLRLVDYTLLSDQEKQWLDNYQKKAIS